jgi:CBS domain-containing protein
VAGLQRKDASTVESTEMLDAVIAKLNECRCDLLPVTREGKLVGVVTTDNLGAFMQLREAAAN